VVTFALTLLSVMATNTTEGQQKEEDVNRLQLSRRAHRGQMTKLYKRGENLVANLDDEDNLDMLNGIIESMDSKLKLLSELDGRIQDVTPEAKLEEAIVEADEYIEEVNVLIRRLKTACKNSRSNDANATNTSRQHTSAKRVNLPKLSLPRFAGDFLDWMTFNDAFSAAIASDDNLDDVQKFQYLRSQLDGEAARTIAGLPLSSANYMEALSLLEKRYGQPHKIVSSYMKALWDLPKPSDNASSIKDFYDHMETYIRGLRSLGKTEDSYGELLVPVIFEKLPSRMKTQISREQGERIWKLPELMNSIYKEIEASQAGEEQHMPTPSAATFFIGSRSRRKPGRSSSTNATSLSCPFCKGNHWPTDCVKFKDPQKRYDVAKQERLCFNCLKGHHSVQKCLAKGRCKHCHHKHHTALCRGSEGTEHKDSKQKKPESYHRTTKSENDRQSNETLVTLTPTATHPSSGTPVLLKTATARIWNGDTAVDVNILLDEGAQRTFITERTTR